MYISLRDTARKAWSNRVGLLSVFGAFIIQLCAGAYHGTFGNILPYLTSYMKQVRYSLHCLGCMTLIDWLQKRSDLNNGDLANIMSIGGLAQGVSFLLGALIFVPLLGPRKSLFLGCFMFTLAPVLTYFCLVEGSSVEYLYIVYGMMSSASVALLTLVTKTLPTSWFPEHKGTVIGFIASGFGLSSTGLILYIFLFYC